MLHEDPGADLTGGYCQVNDDTQFVTSNWVRDLIGQLRLDTALPGASTAFVSKTVPFLASERLFDPPNLGVVGPTCKQVPAQPKR